MCYTEDIRAWITAKNFQRLYLTIDPKSFVRAGTLQEIILLFKKVKSHAAIYASE